MTTPNASGSRTAVYRMYDAAGQLLYVGIASNPQRRWNEHSKQHWYPDVMTWKITWHDTREDALNEESVAIRTETPTYNNRGNPQFVPVQVMSRVVLRSFRASHPLWNAAKVKADERGESVTDVLIRALKRYVRS